MVSSLKDYKSPLTHLHEEKVVAFPVFLGFPHDGAVSNIFRVSGRGDPADGPTKHKFDMLRILTTSDNGAYRPAKPRPDRAEHRDLPKK